MLAAAGFRCVTRYGVSENMLTTYGDDSFKFKDASDSLKFKCERPLGGPVRCKVDVGEVVRRVET